MTKIAIPHDAWIFVGDGRKALFMRNHGDAKFPQFKVERVFEHKSPPTHELGSDQPGRIIQGYKGPGHGIQTWEGGRSAMEEADWHVMEEQRFARETAAALEKLVRERDVKAIVIAAPPRTLAELRKAFHEDVKSRIVAEIDKDLTKHPVYMIEKHLTG